MTETALTPVSEARRMLAVAETPEDLTKLRDFATTARAWAQTRRLGVEQENEAAEVVLRAERKLGIILSDAESKGLYGPGAVQRGSARQSGVRGGAITERADGVLTNEELGIRSQEGINFRRLAAIPDDEFDAMLREVREAGERIAKRSFYKAPITPIRPEPKRPGLAEFNHFRAGAQALTSWEVDASGAGKSRENLLGHLTDDELAQIKALVEALAARYGETVRERRAR